MFNVMKHDQSKFNEVQFLPYVELTEYYHQRKNLKNKEYEYPSPLIKTAVDAAVLDHYNQENHHVEKGDFKSKLEVIEIVCDLQAMAQEFDEGTCRGYFENIWKKKYQQKIICDYEYFSLVDTMNLVIKCFEKDTNESN